MPPPTTTIRDWDLAASLPTIIEQPLGFDTEMTTSELRRNSLNLLLPIQTRVDFLMRYFERDPDAINELLASLLGIYFMSRTCLVREYLEYICRTLTRIPLCYRLQCALDLGHAHDIVSGMFEREEKEMTLLAVPIRLDAIHSLITVPEMQHAALRYLTQIIQDLSLDAMFRLKTLQSLERLSDPDRRHFFLNPLIVMFLKQPDNSMGARTLACQYILTKCSTQTALVEEAIAHLVKVASDRCLEEDPRADACDILLRHGGVEVMDEAKRILMELSNGGTSRRATTIYSNRQNAHVKSIDHNALLILEKILSLEYKDQPFDQVQGLVLTAASHHAQVQSALTRIALDRATYGALNLDLRTILVKVWGYIEHATDFKDEMTQRLIEELIEADQKCSSGFVVRMVNALSGFTDEIHLGISFEEQIVANLEARLNDRIKRIQDGEYRDKILDEMTLDVSLFAERGNFLKFFRENISSIRDLELYPEFRAHMSDTDFDLYIHKAIAHYEGYNF